MICHYEPIERSGQSCPLTVRGGDFITTGEFEWVGQDSDYDRKMVVGEALPRSGAIVSSSGVTVLQSGLDHTILIDQGVEAGWSQEADGLLVRP